MTNFAKHGRILFVTLGLIFGSASCGISDDTVTTNSDLAKEIIGTWHTTVAGAAVGPVQFDYAFGENGVLMLTMSYGQKGSMDSQTFLTRYKIVGDQLIRVPTDRTFHTQYKTVGKLSVRVPSNREPKQKIRISGNALTLEDKINKFQFVRKFKTESVARFITEAIEDLESPDGEVRWRAVQALRYAGPEARAGVPALITTLKDRSSRVRALALEALANIGPQEKGVTSVLIEVLKDKNDPIMAGSAASLLGKFGPAAKDAVPILIEMLKAGDSSIRYYATESLGNIGPEAKPAIPALFECLKDQNELLADVAAKALEKIKSEADSNDDPQGYVNEAT